MEYKPHGVAWKLYPPRLRENSHEIFIDNDDFEWVNTIDNSIWNDFFITLNFSVSNIPNNVKTQIFNSLKILSYRIAALGLEKEIIGKIDAQNELLSPFLIQNKEVYDLVMSLNPGLSATDVTNRFEKITLLLIHCKSNLVLIKEQTSVNGASLHQSFIIKRIEQMIVRMQIMIDLMNDKSLNTPLFVQFFKTIIYEEQNKEPQKKSFDFLLSLTFSEDAIKVISNKSWMKKGQEVAMHGEQPIDVAYTIFTLYNFYKIFKTDAYSKKINLAFNWFMGNNHLQQIIYNPCTGGCYDGLEETQVNLNQGAESSLSYLMARLVIEKHNAEK
jgi:hypothetical protein